MKTRYSNKIIILSMIIFTSITFSCTSDGYVSCVDAKIELVNNSNAYVYYSIDPTDDYCYPENFLYPGESIVIHIGEVQASRNMPVYFEVFYRFNAPGYSNYGLDIDIERCYQKVYIN